MAAGHAHSLALTKNNELYSWGWAYLTGHGFGEDDENVSVPADIKAFKGKKIDSITCGGLHSVVLADGGDLYIWGSSEGGQLGIEVKDGDCCVTRPVKNEMLASKG